MDVRLTSYVMCVSEHERTWERGNLGQAAIEGGVLLFWRGLSLIITPGPRVMIHWPARRRREASCWPQTVQEGTEHSFGHFSGECAPRYFSKFFGIVRIAYNMQCRALHRSQPCVSSGIEETDLCPWSVHESK